MKNIFSAIVLVFLLFSIQSNALAFDCLDLNSKPIIESSFSSSPFADFPFRNTLPKTEVSPSSWKTCCGSFGPCPMTFPRVRFPSGVSYQSWSRVRVVEVAKKMIGTPYGHYHIAGMGGIDCSNFTSWVYNYSFGIRFSSEIKRQSQSAGRLLAANEPLSPGDLIFLWNQNRTEIIHTAIFLDKGHVIDSTEPSVGIRPFFGRYRQQFAWARRIIE